MVLVTIRKFVPRPVIDEEDEAEACALGISGLGLEVTTLRLLTGLVVGSDELE